MSSPARLSIDPLVKAKRRCTIAAFPAWIGRWLAMLCAVFSLPWVLGTIALFAGHSLLVDGRRLGAVLQLLGIGSLLVEWLTALQRFRGMAPWVGRDSWTSELFVLAVAVFLLWAVAAAWRYQALAARFPLSTGSFGIRQRLTWSLHVLRSRRLLPALRAGLLSLVLSAPFLVGAALMVRPPGWASRLADTVISGSAAVKGTAGVVFIVVVFELGRWSHHFLTKAKRLLAIPASEARRLDTRLPVLLLRSFQDDLTPILPRFRPGPYPATSNMAYPGAWTLEEAIEKTLHDFGPVIAVGRPGEPLPPAGAAREYMPNAEWQDRVLDLVREARWVVVVLGKTPGLATEYARLRDHGALSKSVLVFPPVKALELEARWARFLESTAVDASGADAGSMHEVLVATFPDGPAPRFVTCSDRDDSCYEIALQCALGGLLDRGATPGGYHSPKPRPD